MSNDETIRDDHDSPWKEVLERYFPEFLSLLFRVIDWIVRLPASQELEFITSLRRLEEERQMPYITSIERIGIEQGIHQGEVGLLLRLIKTKFGTPHQGIVDQVQAADAETLQCWSERILSAETLAELFE